MSIDLRTSTLSPDEVRDLRSLAGFMIPASVTYNLPSASDDRIFADIVASLGRDTAAVKSALGDLARLAGASFSVMDAGRQSDVAADFSRTAASAAALLGRVVFQCYYRDDRVLRSLNIEPRPPYPKGNVAAEGDWSVIEVMRSRPQSWRQI